MYRTEPVCEYAYRAYLKYRCKNKTHLWCGGQTVYDRLTKPVVVHESHLYRPVYSSEIPPNIVHVLISIQYLSILMAISNNLYGKYV